MGQNRKMQLADEPQRGTSQVTQARNMSMTALLRNIRNTPDIRICMEKKTYRFCDHKKAINRPVDAARERLNTRFK